MMNRSNALAAVAIVVCAAASIAVPTARAADAVDSRDLANLAGCYTDGIDAIGAGKTDAGTEKWHQCFSDDVKFTLSFGAFTMSCPGDKCSLPASMSGLAKRVALAKGTFDRGGYVATSHHLTSLTITQSADDSATVRGHLQAWHFRKDGTAVIGLGTWQVQARKTADGWRIVDEQLDSPQRVVVPLAKVE